MRLKAPLENDMSWLPRTSVVRSAELSARSGFIRAATELLKDPVLNFFPDGQLNPFRLSTDISSPEPPMSAITTAPAVKIEAAASSSSGREPAPAAKVQKETATAVIKYRGAKRQEEASLWPF